MKELRLQSYAKINITLDVVGKREDGYHLLRMIMQTVDLKDEITLTRKFEKGIEIVTDKHFIPTDSRNIAYKAALLFLERSGLETGIHIDIAKNIPVAAGMAGGSSNGAAVLLGMNRMFGNPFKKAQLLEMGLTLGADVPYTMTGGTCLCEGVGERITPLKDFSGVDVLIVKPPFGVSTKDVFREFSLERVRGHVNTDRVIGLMEKKDIRGVSQNMRNLLENVTLRKYYSIGAIKRKMVELGAEGSLMTGSGPTVFGFFTDTEALDRAYSHFSERYKEVYRTRTVRGSILDQ